MNAFVASVRAWAIASLSLMVWGSGQAETPARVVAEKAATTAVPAASEPTAASIKEHNKPLAEKKQQLNVSGGDRQYPAVKPRPPQPPRKPGDLNEKLVNKAVSP